MTVTAESHDISNEIATWLRQKEKMLFQLSKLFFIFKSAKDDKKMVASGITDVTQKRKNAVALVSN